VSESRRFSLDIAEGSLTGLRFGAPGAPPMLFAHANGFCASAYRQALEAVEGYDIFAIDLRGHGRSSLPCDPACGIRWTVYARDIGEAIDAIRARYGAAAPFTLAGHSLGAVAAAMAGEGRRDIAALRLIEPVATPQAVSFLAMAPFWRSFAERLPLVAAARRRRKAFESREAARAAYQSKALFRQFAHGAIDDYLNDGMRETASGVELSCAPAWEAANFAGVGNDFWGAARRRSAPLAVLGAADPTSTLFGSAAARLAKLGAAVTLVEEATHLLPMEMPMRAGLFLGAGR